MICKLHNKNNPPTLPFIKGGGKLTPPLEKGDTGGFSGAKGFTLIEVLIATLILAIGLLSLATLAGTVIRGNSFSNKMTTATTLAQDKMEEIKGLGYDNADTAAGTENYGSIADYVAYKRVATVSTDSPPTGMKTVTVKVSWDADAHFVELKTILAE